MQAPDAIGDALRQGLETIPALTALVVLVIAGVWIMGRLAERASAAFIKSLEARDERILAHNQMREQRMEESLKSGREALSANTAALGEVRQALGAVNATMDRTNRVLARLENGR